MASQGHNELTHWDWVMHQSTRTSAILHRICRATYRTQNCYEIRLWNPDYWWTHWFRKWLVTCLVPSHYLNKCCNIVIGNTTNKLQRNLYRNSIFHWTKCSSNCRLQSGGHFVSALMCYQAEAEGNGGHLTHGDVIFSNENCCILIHILPKFVRNGPIWKKSHYWLPIPEPVLIKTSDAIWRHWVAMS